MGKLNKESSVLLYRQLMGVIRNQVLSGELEENDRIPTEVGLSREYDVSRITVRKTVGLLVEEEILVKRQGIGTFVSQRKLCRDINGLMEFTQSCLAEGDTTRAQLASAELAEATMVDTEELKTQEHKKIIKTVWVRTYDRIPVMFEEDHFPARFAYLLGYNLAGSIYQILAENGTITDNDVKWIEICQVNEIEHKHLDIDPDKPLLYVKDASCDREGNPAHNYKSVVDPDRYEMTAMVNTQEKADRE